MRNNFIFSSLSIFSRLLSGFFLIFFLARLLSVDNFGVFTYSLVFSNILVLIVEYGYNLKLSKDTAIDPDNISMITINTIKVKTLLIIPLLSILLFLKSIEFIESSTFLILFVLTFSAIFNSFANHFLIPYRSIDLFNIETFYVFLNNLFILTFVVLIAYLYNDIFLIALTFLLVKFLFMISTFLKFKKDFGVIIDKEFDILKELKSAFPYAMHIAVGSMYLNIDTLILKEYVSNYNIGIYQAGMRALIASTIGLSIVNSVLVPKLSSLVHNRKKLINMAKKFNRYVFLLGLFIMILINLFNVELITLVFSSKFIELQEYVFLFSIIVFMRYFGTIYGTLLTISDNQKIRTIAVTITLILIIILDLIFIPIFGIYGALYTLIAAHFILNIIYMYFANKEYNTFFV